MVKHPRHRKKALAEIAERIQHYAANLKEWTKADSASLWLENEQQVMAVGLAVQIIGEHANSLLLVWPDLLEEDDLILWEALRTFRHGISHTYDTLNLIDPYYLREKADFLIDWAKHITKNLAKIAEKEAQQSNPRKIYPE